MAKIHNHNHELDRITIEYYTDPLCCWSWSFEPHWRRFITENASAVTWRYRMAGLLPDWSTYHDPLHDITSPVQMGQLWMHAKKETGVFNDERIWTNDPPISSYPACIAVKCAEKQSHMACDFYLQILRQAVMLHRKNIAKRKVILDSAHQLEKNYPQIFDSYIFEKDFDDNGGLSAFRDDFLKAQFHNITRFPTITMKQAGKKSIFIVGYRPYEVLMEAFNQFIEVPVNE